MKEFAGMNRYLCVLVGGGVDSLTRYLVGVVGFLGGYTTFSSFEYDGYLAVRGGHHWTALACLVGSVVPGGYAGVWLGAFLVTKR